MSDYIKREDAIKAVAEYTNDCFGTFEDAILNAEDIVLDSVPSADVIEPKRGEWIERTHDTLIAQVNFAYCSECGQPIMHEHTRPLWNFCPNCGCAMTKE